MGEHRCWSWQHRTAGPTVRTGDFTCPEHDAEADGIRQTIKQLNFCQSEIQRGLRGRVHLSRYEDVVEGNLKGFLQKGLEDFEVRQGNYQLVDTKDRQRDLVVRSRAPVDPDLWCAEVTLPDEFSQSALAVFEVAHAGQGRSWGGKGGIEEKLTTDLKSIFEVIDEGLRHRRKLFTGIALVGAGWQGHERAIAKLLHDAHHGRRLERVTTATGPWWPLIDVVILPGLLFKKHDFFEQRTLESRRWPVLYQWPTVTSDPSKTFRPLSIARGYLRHFLHRARLMADEEPAFELGEAASICGPAPLDKEVTSDAADSWHGRRIGVLIGHEQPDRLQHARDNTGAAWSAVLIERGDLCTEGAPYVAVSPVVDPTGHTRTPGGVYVPVETVQAPYPSDRSVLLRTRDAR